MLSPYNFTLQLTGNNNNNNNIINVLVISAAIYIFISESVLKLSVTSDNQIYIDFYL